ncbi:MAG: hypothetical protein ABS79_00480 [Planctomycetes bacterium SCN 63-9]|nr:MAG: hypothetical protein ABS79_00480 [Planctomycetes bacterium SCN 63-9]
MQNRLLFDLALGQLVPEARCIHPLTGAIKGCCADYYAIHAIAMDQLFAPLWAHQQRRILEETYRMRFDRGTPTEQTIYRALGDWG